MSKAFQNDRLISFLEELKALSQFFLLFSFVFGSWCNFIDKNQTG